MISRKNMGGSGLAAREVTGDTQTETGKDAGSLGKRG